MNKLPAIYHPFENNFLKKYTMGIPFYFVGFFMDKKVVFESNFYQDIYRALNYIPLKRKEYFIFTVDQINKIALYVWNDGRDCWVRIKHGKRYGYCKTRNCFLIYDNLKKGIIDIGAADWCNSIELFDLLCENRMLDLISIFNRIEDSKDIKF